MNCPYCRKDFDPREAFMDEEWRAILLMQPKFGEHSRLVFEYCELFGVHPLTVKTKKLLRLLQEIAVLLEKKRFSYQKREYDTEIPIIVEALKTVCNKHFAQPLENHNYLKRVLLSIAEREGTRARCEREKYLRQREAGKPRDDGRPLRSDEGREEPKDMEDDIENAQRKTREALEETRQRRGVASLLDTIGKKMP